MRNLRLLLITRERFGLATWNFDSSLRLLTCMFVSNFEAIGHVTLVLGPKYRPASLHTKAVSLKNGLKYDIKYFTRLYVLSYLFIATNSLLAAMRFFSYFSSVSLFFSSYILYALFLLNHKTSKSNFLVKLFSCKRNFVSRNILGPLPWEPSQNRAQKLNFIKMNKMKTAQTRALVFLISADT